MRLLFVGLLGLMLGGGVGGALLYLNPLTWPDEDPLLPLGGEPLRLRYSTAGPEVLAFTHSTPLDQIDVHPASVPTLWETALAKTALSVLVATGDAGTPTALVSRLSKLSPLTNPITNGVVVADDWLVTVPGDGTYVIESNSNLWPLLRDTVIDVGLFRRAWSEPRDYRLTIGPDLSGAGVLTGVSGIYRDVAGTVVDTLHLDGFGRLAELAEPIAGTLDVRLRAAEAEAVDDETQTLNVAGESP